MKKILILLSIILITTISYGQKTKRTDTSTSTNSIDTAGCGCGSDCPICTLPYDSNNYYGYKLVYDPITNTTCIYANKTGKCNCGSNDHLLPGSTFSDQNLFHSVPTGSPFLLEITDINPLKYKINITGQAENLGGYIGQLETVALGALSALPKFSGSGVLAMLDSATAWMSKPQGGGYLSYNLHLYGTTKKKNFNCEKLDSIVIDSIKKSLVGFKSGESIQLAWDTMNAHLNKKGCFINSTIYNAISKAIKVKIAIDSLMNVSKNDLANVVVDYTDIKEYYARLATCDKLDITVSKKCLCNLLKRLSTALGCDDKALNASCFKDFVDRNKKKFDDIKTANPDIYKAYFVDGFITYIDKGLLNKMDSLCTVMMTQTDNVIQTGIPSFYRFNIPVVPTDADRVKFNITIQPRKDSIGGGYHVINQPIFISTRGGWHFDFGLGLMATGHPNPLYYYANDTVTAKSSTGPVIGKNGLDSVIPGQVLKQEAIKSQVNFGISAQLFLMYRLGRYNYFGGTLGLGFTSDLNGVGMLGLSYMTGASQKIAFSAGIAGSTLSEPSDYYNMTNGVSTVFLPAGTSSIQYKIDIRTNWFVGITIAFGKTTTAQTAPTTPPPSGNTTNTNNNTININGTATPAGGTAPKK